MRSAFFVGRVLHARLKPRRHRLAYRVFWLHVDLDEVEAIRGRFLSISRFNLMGFHPADHGTGQASDAEGLRAYVMAQLKSAGLETAGWRISLLTMPRILGHVFNPLSIFFCHDAGDQLRAVLYEVSNTFGERHSYLMPVEPGATAPFRHACDKAFYVSPFIDMAMHYAFTIEPPGDRMSVAIAVSDPEGPLLNAVMAGERVEINDSAVLRLFFTHPLLTLKVVAAIHWEAIFLWFKRVGFRHRPPPPSRAVTIVSGQSGGRD